MARNHEIQAAWAYHDATKHSLESVRASQHRLDWANQPRPYKLYAHLEAMPLPADFGASRVPALTAIAAGEAPHAGSRIPDLQTLTMVLQFSAGITKQLRYPGGLMPFRAAACTGALYHIELYVVSGPLPDIHAGVYQFGVHDFALRRIRAGDFRGALVAATGGEQAVADAPVVLVATSTFWRNAWKYQDRAYRHSFWDSGTILANLLAMTAAHELPARIVVGFADAEVNRLLDVDAEQEAAVAVVPLGFAPELTPATPSSFEALHLETVPESHVRVEYPAIPAMHAAASLTDVEVGEWRNTLVPTLSQRERGPAAPAESEPASQPPTSHARQAAGSAFIPLRAMPLGDLPQESIEEVIRKRGSSRRFTQAPISFEALSTMLVRATAELPADFRQPDDSPLSTPYLIVNAVDGLASGTYVFHRDRQALELLRAGDFRRQAGYLDLTQELGADAAVNVYFLADLHEILPRLGNRGYRAGHLDASITAGKLYLAAYALGLGASGLTFFDDDVTEFFSPHAADQSVMFLIAIGEPLRRRAG